MGRGDKLVLTLRAKTGKIEVNGGKMTRYGVGVILEREGFSLPVGLEPRLSHCRCVCVFLTAACQSCAAAIYLSMFKSLWDFCSSGTRQTGKE